MADAVDITEAINEILMPALLSQRKEPAPKATGFCLNCEEPTTEGVRWCSPDCRDDWQREYNRQGNGG